MYPYTVLEARSLKSRCWPSCTPSKSSTQGSILCPPPASGSCMHSLTCGQITLIFASVVTLPSSLLCVFSSVCLKFTCLSLIRTLVIGFRAYQNSPGVSQVKILNLITSEKTTFLNKVTFTDSRDLV